jgi:hypothetical protein
VIILVASAFIAPMTSKFNTRYFQPTAEQQQIARTYRHICSPGLPCIVPIMGVSERSTFRCSCLVHTTCPLPA